MSPLPSYKLVWLVFLWTLFTENVAAQFINRPEDRERPREIAPQSPLVVAHASLGWYLDAFPKLLRMCRYHEQWGAPPTSESTVNFFNIELPGFIKDLDTCYASKYGKQIDPNSGDYREVVMKVKSPVIDLLLSIPLSPPKDRSQLTDCDIHEVFPRSVMEGFSERYGYPKGDWCNVATKAR